MIAVEVAVVTVFVVVTGAVELIVRRRRRCVPVLELQQANTNQISEQQAPRHV
jgi:hypothetical protein